MRLIDGDDFQKRIEQLCDALCEYSKKQRQYMCSACKLGDVLDVIDDAPTVEDVPVRHGQWIRVYSRPGVFKYLGWTCDQCGQRTGNEYAPQWYKFCPNCGARMDGKDGEAHGTI